MEVRSGNKAWTMESTPVGSLRRLVRRTIGMRAVAAQKYGYDDAGLPVGGAPVTRPAGP